MRWPEWNSRVCVRARVCVCECISQPVTHSQSLQTFPTEEASHQRRGYVEIMILHNSTSPFVPAPYPPAGCPPRRLTQRPHRYASQMFPLPSETLSEFHIHYRRLLFHFNGLPLFWRRRKEPALSTLINFQQLPFPRPPDIKPGHTSMAWTGVRALFVTRCQSRLSCVG